MKWTAQKRPQSVLGLSLTDGQLRAFQLGRGKNGPEVVKSTTAALTLTLQHPEADLVGREIRNHLDAAGIHERRCVVALPPGWVIAQHTPVPDLAPEDAASFLQLEAEKAFPVDLDQLQLAQSPQRSGGAVYVTQLAVRREQIEHLSAVLKAAGLRPASYSLGLPAMPEVVMPSGRGRVTVVIEPRGATLLVSAGGGIAAFRTSEASIESEAGENVINGATVARELRITLQQLPTELRKEVRDIRLLGEASMVASLGETINDWARVAGLAVSREGTPDGAVNDAIATAVARRWLENAEGRLEFLPPRPSRWSVLATRYSSKRLTTVGFAVGALAVVILIAFGWQQYRLWSLRAEWSGMQGQVTDLQRVEARINEYRSWYDTGFRNLSILKRVTECFPDNGSVTAKSIEIRNPANVNVTGTARDNAALLKTMDQLRNAREVRGVKLEQIHGKTPAQFTFSFQWVNTSGT